MKTHYDQIKLTSNGRRVSYFNITNQVKDIVKASEIKNGICTIQSPHTTCSVIFEEYVHDTDYNGDEFLQVDMNRILDRIIPRQLTENTDYRYPGLKHVDFLHDLAKEDPTFPTDPATILNADAHLRASFLGASETFVLKDGNLKIGSVGYIYFIDFDQNRVRERKCQVMIIGE